MSLFDSELLQIKAVLTFGEILGSRKNCVAGVSGRV